jgi:AdoMet-dependent heme synthase
MDSALVETMGQPTFDFNSSPFLILWELTRACALACRHCRAKAMPRRNKGELTTEECAEQFDKIREFGSPLIVLTGGDPIERPDVYEIISEARRRGFKVAMTPSATPSVTRAVVLKLKEAGLERLAISLDGPDEAAHDSFRGIRGSFEDTLSIMRWAYEAGLPLQVNTTVWKENIDRFQQIADLVIENHSILWSLFFLVPTGRARSTMQITAEQAEQTLHRMADLAQSNVIDVKSTAAPHFRRVLIERNFHRPLRDIGPDVRLGALRSYQSVNDGKGLLFISHLGDVQPSGFLPISAGNVRQQSVADIYRSSELFKDLRSPQLLKGKCGRCPYKAVCGGSRARAYADSGDYMAADELCSYQPN